MVAVDFEIRRTPGTRTLCNKKTPPRRGVPNEKGGSGGSLSIQQSRWLAKTPTLVFARWITDDHSRR
jgi:hypothetical protein